MKYTAIISADELLTEDIIQDLKDTMFFGDDPAYAFEIEDIKLEQEPRKGHWTCDRANVRCSCCGKGYKDFYGKARIASYNYCPNCGAKMESEDNNAESPYSNN